MDKKQYDSTILELREVMKGHTALFEEIESGEQMKSPQPPLEKPWSGGKLISLTKEFEGVIKKSNILDIINDRKSRRNYSEEELTLDELAFLLWSTQGVKKVIGRERKATIRTVPSAGAKHPFDTYLFINRVEGLEPGLYHYLALEHKLEHIESNSDQVERLTEASCGQAFFANASVAFVWTVTPYRTEWRYTVKAQKYALIDAGHLCQNLYLACEAIGCGACAIGAYDQELSDNLLHLDSSPSSSEENEFVIYAASVGKIKNEEV